MAKNAVLLKNAEECHAACDASMFSTLPPSHRKGGICSMAAVHHETPAHA
jgi:hypothetical protein